MLIPPLPLLNFFVATVMFSIGLRVSGEELLDILRDRALLTRTLLANCVLIPAIGFLLIRIFPLTPDASIGILLLAAIPEPRSPCNLREWPKRSWPSLPP